MSDAVPAKVPERELAQPVQRPPLWLRLLVSSTLTGMGLISLIYLVNPTGGLLELIPDGFPLIGNLDEAGATAVLLMVMSYWGLDVTRVGSLLRDHNLGRKALPPPEDEKA